MSDEPETTTTTTTDTVPRERFAAVAKHKKALEEQLAALTAEKEAWEAERLTGTEKAQKAVEKAMKERDEYAAKVAALETGLRSSAVASYFKDAHDPMAMAKLVPADLIEMDGTGITEETMKRLDGFRESNAWGFREQQRGGSVPGPSGSGGKSAQDRYAEAIAKGDTEAARKAFSEMS